MAEEDVKATFDMNAFREYEECIVDAENYAEISDCYEVRAEPKAPEEEDFFTSLSNFFGNLMPKAVNIDVEECIIQSENAAEAAACRA